MADPTRTATLQFILGRSHSRWAATRPAWVRCSARRIGLSRVGLAHSSSCSGGGSWHVGFRLGSRLWDHPEGTSVCTEGEMAQMPIWDGGCVESLRKTGGSQNPQNCADALHGGSPGFRPPQSSLFKRNNFLLLIPLCLTPSSSPHFAA